jgi:hypothetical protein
MPTITVRISEEDRKRLLKYGAVSRSVREALQVYLDAKKSQELIARLEELQHRNPVRTTSVEEIHLIEEDRGR